MRRVPPRLLAAALLPGALLAGALIAPVVSAQSERTATDPGEAREQAREAERRAERLEAQARRADEAVAATAREAAALAARVQEAEAAIAAAEVRLARIDDQRAELAERLAERREPLLRLTGALQKVARRPPILSALAPDTLRETVYLRAVLETTMPEIRRRTAALREEIRLGRALEREARRMVAGLRANERALEARRARLAAVETRQRLESRRRGGAAAREADRALALAEEARDLDALARRLDETASLRAELAALPAPLLRPANGTRAPAPSRGASEPGIERAGEYHRSALSAAGRRADTDGIWRARARRGQRDGADLRTRGGGADRRPRGGPRRLRRAVSRLWPDRHSRTSRRLDKPRHRARAQRGRGRRYAGARRAAGNRRAGGPGRHLRASARRRTGQPARIHALTGCYRPDQLSFTPRAH